MTTSRGSDTSDSEDEKHKQEKISPLIKEDDPKWRYICKKLKYENDPKEDNSFRWTF